MLGSRHNTYPGSLLVLVILKPKNAHKLVQEVLKISRKNDVTSDQTKYILGQFLLSYT